MKICLRADTCFLFLFLIIMPALAHYQVVPGKGSPVRVRILHNADSIKVNLHNNWQISGTSDSVSVSDIILNLKINAGKISAIHDDQVIFKSDNVLIFSSSEQGTMRIFDVPFGVGWWWEGREERIYEGRIYFYISPDNGIDAVVHLPLEQYLKGVIPYEIGNDAPQEALKAQAVAARSEAVMSLRSRLYSGPQHDLTSGVECQVFAGNHKRTALTDQAVEATAGVVLSENDQPIHAYYASNCGGHSERIGNIWPDRQAHESYLRALSDTESRSVLDLSAEDNIKKWIESLPGVYCNPFVEKDLPSWSSMNFRWQKIENIEIISERLRPSKETGLLTDIKALERGNSGRIITARFVFENDSFDVQGELNIRQLWRPALRSSCFTVQFTDTSVILSGAGWGHGVGMCQSGAIAQALKGKDYVEILLFYYPKAKAARYY